MTPDEQAAIDAAELRDRLDDEERRNRARAEWWEAMVLELVAEVMAVADKHGRG
jgi:hypothetical protein